MSFLGGIQPAAPEQRGGDGRRSKGEATDGGAKGRRRTEEQRGGDGRRSKGEATDRPYLYYAISALLFYLTYITNI